MQNAKATEACAVSKEGTILKNGDFSEVTLTISADGVKLENLKIGELRIEKDVASVEISGCQIKSLTVIFKESETSKIPLNITGKSEITETKALTEAGIQAADAEINVAVADGVEIKLPSGLSGKPLVSAASPLYSQVIFDGVEYDVIKNPYTTAESVKNNLSPRFDKQDALLNKILSDEFNISEGIILFQREVSRSVSYLKEVYKILSRDLVFLAKAEFRYVAEDICSDKTGTAAQRAAFADIPTAQLRSAYEPSRIGVNNEKGFYGNDYSKMKSAEYKYYYSDGGKKVDFSSLYRVLVKSGGIEKEEGNVSAYITEANFYNKDGSGKQKMYQTIDASTGSFFSQLAKNTNNVGSYLTVTGDGKVGGNANIDDYRSFVYLQDVYGLDGDNPYIQFQIRLRKVENEVENLINYLVNFYTNTDNLEVSSRLNSGTWNSISGCTTWDDFNALVDSKVFTSGKDADGSPISGVSFKDCIVIDKDWTAGTMPKSVTLTAPYADRSSVLQKYGRATFNWDEGRKQYVVDTSGFVEAYKKDFVQLYKNPGVAIP